MGKTAFSGPVYGSKSLLWVAGPAAAASTSASTVLAFAQPGYATRIVPPTEDWYVTEGYVVCSTASTVAGANQWKLKVEGGSTTIFRPSAQGATNAATILTITSGSSVAPMPPVISSNVNGMAYAAITPGEFEGTWCPAGSTLRWCSSYADAPTTPQFQVMGYIRYLSSTRLAE